MIRTDNTDPDLVAFQKEHIVEGIGALTIAPNDSGPPILSMDFDEPMELNSGLDIAHGLRNLIALFMHCPVREEKVSGVVSSSDVRSASTRIDIFYPTYIHDMDACRIGNASATVPLLFDRDRPRVDSRQMARAQQGSGSGT